MKVASEEKSHIIQEFVKEQYEFADFFLKNANLRLLGLNNLQDPLLVSVHEEAVFARSLKCGYSDLCHVSHKCTDSPPISAGHHKWNLSTTLPEKSILFLTQMVLKVDPK